MPRISAPGQCSHTRSIGQHPYQLMLLMYNILRHPFFYILIHIIEALL
uniref:Uncharacterized protein n=1 Tax=Populus trichocarpa TaxID=3694 RepID=A9P884_POPTR|nr:unknown [Populus trichocarpa]